MVVFDVLKDVFWVYDKVVIVLVVNVNDYLCDMMCEVNVFLLVLIWVVFVVVIIFMLFFWFGFLIFC